MKTWLNLNALPRDVRKMIYRLLNPLDKVKVEMAHGVVCMYGRECPHDQSCGCIFSRLKYWSAHYGDVFLFDMIKRYPHLHEAHPYGYFIWRESLSNNRVSFMNAAYCVYECGDCRKKSPAESSQVEINTSGRFWWRDKPLATSCGSLQPDTLKWLRNRAAIWTGEAYDAALASGNFESADFIELNYRNCSCGYIGGFGISGYGDCGSCDEESWHVSRPESTFDTRHRPWDKTTWVKVFRSGNIPAIKRFYKVNFCNDLRSLGMHLRDCVYYPEYYSSVKLLAIVEFLCTITLDFITVPHFSPLYIYAAGIVGTNDHRMRDGIIYDSNYTPSGTAYRQDRSIDWDMITALHNRGCPISPEVARIVFSRSVELYTYVCDWFKPADDFALYVARGGDLRILEYLPLTRELLSLVLMRGDDEVFAKLYAKFLSQ